MGEMNMTGTPLDRPELRAAGRRVRDAMQHGSFGTTTNLPLAASVPDFGDFTTEAVFGAVWGRRPLDLEQRMLCSLGALAAGEFLGQLRTYMHSALTLGISREAIQETLIQVGWYAGMPTLVNGISTANAVFAERRIGRPAARPADDRTLDELRTAGAELASIGAHASSGTWTEQLDELERIYCYGQIWSRPGLQPTARSGVAIAAVTAIGCTSELRTTIPIGLHHGLHADEIAEVILQTAPYSGYSRAKAALTILDEISPRSGQDNASAEL
jgi:4-carboxymuconolactone decarboxylase